MAVLPAPPSTTIVPLPSAPVVAEPPTTTIVLLPLALVDAEPPLIAMPMASAPNGDAALLADQCEGHCFDTILENFLVRPCQRPGCYELFGVPTEWSLRRFCDGVPQGFTASAGAGSPLSATSAGGYSAALPAFASAPKPRK